MKKLFTVAEHSEVVSKLEKPAGLSNIRILYKEADEAPPAETFAPTLVIRKPFWKKCLCFKKILTNA